MKQIVKGSEPVELTRRRGEIKGTPGIGNNWYAALHVRVAAANRQTLADVIKQQCLREQQYLCAYTMIQIEIRSSHLEHMYPQEYCSPEESIDYKNLVACFPLSAHPGFGARQKDNWPSEKERHLFVKPTDAGCESRFAYTRDGHVAPSSIDDIPATTTIAMINLNHDTLVKNRRDALVPLLKLTDVSALRKRIRDLEHGKNGKLEEYVIAKQQLLTRRIRLQQERRKYIKLQMRER